jgi:hypothetical protein
MAERSRFGSRIVMRVLASRQGIRERAADADAAFD